MPGTPLLVGAGLTQSVPTKPKRYLFPCQMAQFQTYPAQAIQPLRRVGLRDYGSVQGIRVWGLGLRW